MSNKLYDDQLYNEEIKNEYLNQVTSTNSIMRIFKASAPVEEFYEKDLYEFSREELRKLLFSLNPEKYNSSRQNGSRISNYINWAVSKGYRKTINPLLVVDKEWYRQFVSAEKSIFTEEELNSFIHRCKNAQDAVIISLRKEGVGGQSNSELINLKIHDVDVDNNKLHLTDLDHSKRILRVSDQCINLCLRAFNQETYLKKNGEYKKETKSIMTNLVENDYILRSSITRTENYQEAEKFLIHRRLAVLSESFGKPNLTPKNISYSGMLIMARDIYLKKGKLEPVDYRNIFERFGIKNLDQNGGHGQYYYRLKNEFLNINKIKELYNV